MRQAGRKEELGGRFTKAVFKDKLRFTKVYQGLPRFTKAGFKDKLRFTKVYQGRV